ncbi:diguanylate cyclase domain-containing protein [Noviherbaspirillum sp.]|uniref:diguanylate cyclase domain-containing protein n=1 Tax=Noviherbaspirillum sp. TaxID=1926288 RepID=UPI002D22771A|nr:diguanylate cyclase [Noviherbaspirillum sp.]HZW22758.1 diguanylate cyclase [Noviherbaspirillum sp.]
MQSNTGKPQGKRNAGKAQTLSALNKRLSLALEGSGQIAFDWSIPNDCLHFSGTLAGNLKALMLDTSKTWRSSALPAIIHRDDLASFRSRLHEALKGNGNDQSTSYRAEVRIKDSVRGWRWVCITGRITQRHSAGRALRMAGTFSDIDERKKAEARVSRLRDLYAALSQTNQAIVRATDLDTLFRDVCRIAVEHGRFELAWIGQVDDANGCITPCAAHGRLPAHFMDNRIPLDAASPPHHRVVATAGREGHPDICNDLDLMPAGRNSVDSGQGSIASFPFTREGKTAGTLNLYSSTARFFDDQLIDLLSEMSRDISFAVDNFARESQRKAMEAALIESEQFKSAILTAALDCIVTIDESGTIISFNHAAEQTFGRKSDDVLGKNLADLIIPPQWRARHRQGVERFLSTGESFLLNRRIELTAMRADGGTFPVELAVVPLRVRGERMYTAFIRDISEVKRSQAILKDSAIRYRQLVELSPEATFVYQDGKIMLFNQAASRLLGVRDPEDLLGRSIFDFVHPDCHAVFEERGRLRPHEAQPMPFVEQKWLRQDGSIVPVEIGATNLMYNDMPSVQVVVRDITERKRAEALQLGQNHVLNMVATGVALPEILSAIARFVESQSGEALCAILPLSNDGISLQEKVAPCLPAECIDTIGDVTVACYGTATASATNRPEPLVVSDIATDPRWEGKRDAALEHGLRSCVLWPIQGKHKKVLGTFALYFRTPRAAAEKDMRLCEICANLAGIAIESRASEEKIRYLAHYDGLTSLPNRFLFKEYLDLALRSARRHGNKFAVLFLDLDKFKEINDTLGHDAGDIVLCEIASRLRNCLRHTDKIARMGGDEFYVLIEDLDDGRYAADIAQKLLEAASRPVDVGGKECRLSVSIGIAIFPNDGNDGATLLKNADKAMYKAKDMGKNGFQACSTLDSRGTDMLPPWPSMQAVQHALLS